MFTGNTRRTSQTVLPPGKIFRGKVRLTKDADGILSIRNSARIQIIHQYAIILRIGYIQMTRQVVVTIVIQVVDSTRCIHASLRGGSIRRILVRLTKHSSSSYTVLCDIACIKHHNPVIPCISNKNSVRPRIVHSSSDILRPIHPGSTYGRTALTGTSLPQYILSVGIVGTWNSVKP